MSVPLFPFDNSIRTLYQDGIDTILYYLGRPCKIVMDGDLLQCPNCLFDSIAGRSSGIYNGSGPRSFTRPPCPVCRGDGYDPTTEDYVEYVTLGITKNKKADQLLPPGLLTTPANLAVIKGTVDQIPLIQTAKYIILDYQNALYTEEKYVLQEGTKPKLDGSIVPGRYFTAILRQIE